MVIVTLSTYLLSLRLSGDLEVVTSVGRGCSTTVKDRFFCHVYVFEVCRLGTNLSRTVVSSYLARGNSGLIVVVVCIASAGWSRRSLLYSLAFVGLAVGGFHSFLDFSAPFFSALFPCTSKVRLVLAVWGAKLLGVGYLGWASARDFVENLLCFLFFLLL